MTAPDVSGFAAPGINAIFMRGIYHLNIEDL